MGLHGPLITTKCETEPREKKTEYLRAVAGKWSQVHRVSGEQIGEEIPFLSIILCAPDSGVVGRRPYTFYSTKTD
jgi:hypothetical protein